jgi:hypothetical protein
MDMLAAEAMRRGRRPTRSMTRMEDQVANM